MVAPVAKGIIVATTLLLAAGLAAYENEQIRAWIETQRRKIAVVLGGADYEAADEKERERRADDLAVELRDEVIRRHRDEIFERARKEGVAVDWDELAAVERLYEEQTRKAAEAAATGAANARRASAQTFDEIVGSDGMLRDRDITSGVASGVEGGSAGGSIRQRGLAGLGRGAAFANPFDDEAQLLFDQELIGAGGEEMAGLLRADNTSRTIAADPDLDSLVDVHETPYKSDEELNDEIQEAIRRSLEDVTLQQEQPVLNLEDDTVPETSHLQEPNMSLQNSIYQSYYYGGNPSTHSPSFLSATDSPTASHTAEAAGSPATLLDEDSDDALTPAGTLTPTTEAGFSSVDGDSASDAGEDSLYGEPSAIYHSFNVGDMLDSRLREQQRLQEQRHEEGAQHGVTGDDDSGDDFSVVDGEGAHTPGSWTDVESVGGFDEEEDGTGSRGRREESEATIR